MSYTAFQNIVSDLIKKAGGGITVRLSSDSGNHRAVCSDGTTILANESCMRISVRWGGSNRNHHAIARV